MQSRVPIDPSFGDLLVKLQAGDDRSVSILWERYFKRMLLMARKKMAGAHRQARDEEDIALSAFKSFCLGFQNGRFEWAGDDSELWPLLVTLTINKTIDHLRRENRKKRKPEVDVQVTADVLLSDSYGPELQLIADESFAKVIAALDVTGDESLRRLMLLKLENQPNAEIALELGCTVRTVQRKLMTIRSIWEAIEL